MQTYQAVRSQLEISDERSGFRVATSRFLCFMLPPPRHGENEPFLCVVLTSNPRRLLNRLDGRRKRSGAVIGQPKFRPVVGEENAIVRGPVALASC